MDKTILAPGPTQCDKRFLNLLSKPVMYHRCSDFHKLYSETRSYLKQIVSQENGEVLLLTSSGTGAMEASVSNFFNAGDEVLVISTGHFGHRFNDICKAYNLNVTMLDYEIGNTYDKDEVKSYIESHKNLKGVFATYHETSSGVLNDLEFIGNLISDKCLFIVDAISGLMIHPMYMSKWNIDVLLACSQKGFLIPPGIAIACLSSKAVKDLDSSNSPRYYFDFRKYINMLDINETPFTPNTSLILSMHDACKYLLEDYGLDNYYNHHKELWHYLYNQIKSRAYKIVDEFSGSFLVLFKVKEGQDAKIIHDKLDEKGFIVATGFGENKSKYLRVGIVGAIDKADIDKFLNAFDEVVNEL